MYRCNGSFQNRGENILNDCYELHLGDERHAYRAVESRIEMQILRGEGSRFPKRVRIVNRLGMIKSYSKG